MPQHDLKPLPDDASTATSADPALLDETLQQNFDLLQKLEISSNPAEQDLAAFLRMPANFNAFLKHRLVEANQRGHSAYDEWRTAKRDELLRELYRTMTAADIHQQWSRYHSSSWPRDRIKLPPEQEPQRSFYQMLKLKDFVPKVA